MIDLVRKLRAFRLPVLVLFDASAWVASYVLFTWLRFDQVSSAVPWLTTLAVALGTALVYTVVAWVSQLHRGRSALASLEEMVLLGAVLLGVVSLGAALSSGATVATDVGAGLLVDVTVGDGVGVGVVANAVAFPASPIASAIAVAAPAATTADFLR